MEKFDEQKDYTTNDLARMISSLSGSFSQLEGSQTKLESSFARLEDSQTKLENSQTRLESSFSKLEEKFDRLYEYTVNGFNHMDHKIDFIHRDLKDELDFKFNGLNLRLDDLANTKADKTDLKKVATRVEALETLAVNSQK